ncbi:protein SENSITIVITY TO RED LIGHT REDUCED 1 isoform X2 [Cryptomeria japonica]|nr:protein SENSITIVITY TO RED LIGHT REDUCED 1 isoform X2 [Cryptomeria japonica]XP_057853996.2 protein SENSITIVITY TO RED LIGHT REDUCED 1 isoform X2 [Cryptomeria japonica]
MEWTVVVGRKKKNNASRYREPRKIDTGSSDQTQYLSMAAYAFEAGGTEPVDSDEDDKIMSRMRSSLKKVAESTFYKKLLEQLQSPEVLNSVMRVVGMDSQLQMVVYGIGSIGDSERSRLQLSLALLLKQRFCWVGEIEVFDPIVTASEYRVIKSLGCTFAEINEQGRRTVNRPTLFFMPHCEAFLYDNVLQVNWSALLLNRIVFFGNSFNSYLENSSVSRNPPGYVLAIAEHVHEFEILTVSSDFFPAFNNMSWHFFHLDPSLDLKTLKI